MQFWSVFGGAGSIWDGTSWYLVVLGQYNLELLGFTWNWVSTRLVCLYILKIDQGALGMSDPCGTLPLALKPNAVPRINCLLSNFYFCAN